MIIEVGAGGPIVVIPSISSKDGYNCQDPVPKSTRPTIPPKDPPRPPKR